MERAELRRLIDAHLDGTAAPGEREQLSAALSADPAAARELAEAARFHVLLYEVTRESARRSRKIVPLVVAVAAGIVLILTAIFIFLFQPGAGRARREILGRVVATNCAATLIMPDGTCFPAPVGTLLDRHTTVEVAADAGPDAAVVLIVADTDTIILGCGTRLGLEDRGAFTLHTGRVQCNVTPVAVPFTIYAAPTGTTIRVMGTEFTVEILSQPKGDPMRNQFLMATLVTVLSGTVSVMSAGEGEVAVTPGQSVTVTANTDATSPAVPGKPTDKAIVAMLANSMSFDFNNVPLNQVIGYIQKLSGGALKVSVNAKNLPETAVDEDGNVIVPITLKAQDMQLQNVLFWVAHLAGMECEIKDGTCVMDAPGLLANSTPMHVPGEEATEWYRDIQDRLTKPISFEFNENPFIEVIQWMKLILGKSIIIDSSVERNVPIMLKVKEMKFSGALKWICRLNNTDYTIAHEAILVTSNPDHRQAAPVLVAEECSPGKIKNANAKVAALLQKSACVDFVDTPISDVVMFMSKISGVNIIINAGLIDNGRFISTNTPAVVTIKVENQSLESILRQILLPIGWTYTYTIRDGAVLIQGPAPTPAPGPLTPKDIF